jgi:hypothetical protein
MGKNGNGDDGQFDLFDMPELPSQSRGDQIFGNFKLFNEDNPKVWVLLQRFAGEIQAAGFRHYSIDSIFERIRWHVAIETHTEEPVKLNNNYRAYYARMYAAAFPEHAGFFRTRRRISAEKPAAETDIAVFNTGPAQNEEKLMGKLRELIPMEQRQCAKCGRKGWGAEGVAKEHTREINWSNRHELWLCLYCYLNK